MLDAHRVPTPDDLMESTTEIADPLGLLDERDCIEVTRRQWGKYKYDIIGQSNGRPVAAIIKPIEYYE